MLYLVTVDHFRVHQRPPIDDQLGPKESANIEYPEDALGTRIADLGKYRQLKQNTADDKNESDRIASHHPLPVNFKASVSSCQQRH